jgi:hypothetical protein
MKGRALRSCAAFAASILVSSADLTGRLGSHLPAVSIGPLAHAGLLDDPIGHLWSFLRENVLAKVAEFVTAPIESAKQGLMAVIQKAIESVSNLFMEHVIQPAIRWALEKVFPGGEAGLAKMRSAISRFFGTVDGAIERVASLAEAALAVAEGNPARLRTAQEKLEAFLEKLKGLNLQTLVGILMPIAREKLEQFVRGKTIELLDGASALVEAPLEAGKTAAVTALGSIPVVGGVVAGVADGLITYGLGELRKAAFGFVGQRAAELASSALDRLSAALTQGAAVGDAWLEPAYQVLRAALSQAQSYIGPILATYERIKGTFRALEALLSQPDRVKDVLVQEAAKAASSAHAQWSIPGAAGEAGTARPAPPAGGTLASGVPKEQSGWRWCNKCQALIFGGAASAGPCPAGGEHNRAGGYYTVPTVASANGGQSNWRWCRKCQGLAFAGARGACSAGGPHDYAGSGDYSLLHQNHAPGSQTNWRWCSKCGVLSFAGAGPGACGARGSHDHSGSGDYGLVFALAAPAAPAVRPPSERAGAPERVSPAPGTAGPLEARSGELDEPGWRRCDKCQALVFGGTASAGRCPGGGAHGPAVGDYTLQRVAPGKRAQAQYVWRRCRKCQALGFARDRGSCATGGAHDYSGSSDYFLSSQNYDPRPQQQMWQECPKCGVLHHVGVALGACATGGKHSLQRRTFSLIFTPGRPPPGVAVAVRSPGAPRPGTPGARPAAASAPAKPPPAPQIHELPSGGPGPIHVIYAHYFATCGTQWAHEVDTLRRICAGKQTCDYFLDFGKFSRIQPRRCAHSFSVGWLCGGSPRVHDWSTIAGPNRMVRLRCGAPAAVAQRPSAPAIPASRPGQVPRPAARPIASMPPGEIRAMEISGPQAQELYNFLRPIDTAHVRVRAGIDAILVHQVVPLFHERVVMPAVAWAGEKLLDGSRAKRIVDDVAESLAGKAEKVAEVDQAALLAIEGISSRDIGRLMRAEVIIRERLQEVSRVTDTQIVDRILSRVQQRLFTLARSRAAELLGQGFAGIDEAIAKVRAPARQLLAKLPVLGPYLVGASDRGIHGELRRLKDKGLDYLTGDALLTIRRAIDEAGVASKRAGPPPPKSPIASKLGSLVRAVRHQLDASRKTLAALLSRVQAAQRKPVAARTPVLGTRR